jgi:hypothetical protein
MRNNIDLKKKSENFVPTAACVNFLSIIWNVQFFCLWSAARSIVNLHVLPAGILPTVTFPTWFPYRSYSWTNSDKMLWWRIVHVLSAMNRLSYYVCDVVTRKGKLQLPVAGYGLWLRPFDGGKSATCTFTAPSNVVNLCSFLFPSFFSRRQIFFTPSNVGTHKNIVGLEY